VRSIFRSRTILARYFSGNRIFRLSTFLGAHFFAGILLSNGKNFVCFPTYQRKRKKLFSKFACVMPKGWCIVVSRMNEPKTELLEAGREWLMDCYPDYDCQSTIQALHWHEIIDAINREWSGGWSAFENNFDLSNEYRNA
tara:strand:- start:110 stop:529 length:420 start_codon:yes stop_codon:yes gene_type:complete